MGNCCHISFRPKQTVEIKDMSDGKYYKRKIVAFSERNPNEYIVQQCPRYLKVTEIFSCGTKTNKEYLSVAGRQAIQKLQVGDCFWIHSTYPDDSWDLWYIFHQLDTCTFYTTFHLRMVSSDYSIHKKIVYISHRKENENKSFAAVGFEPFLPEPTRTNKWLSLLYYANFEQERNLFFRNFVEFWNIIRLELDSLPPLPRILHRYAFTWRYCPIFHVEEETNQKTIVEQPESIQANKIDEEKGMNKEIGIISIINEQNEIDEDIKISKENKSLQYNTLIEKNENVDQKNIVKSEPKQMYVSDISNGYELRGICVICLENVSNICFLPCKHLASCEICTEKLSKPLKCPFCNLPILDKFKLFIP